VNLRTTDGATKTLYYLMDSREFVAAMESLGYRRAGGG
jgi:hypothetical protein